ncbi:hypothetical protein BDC45DRAFT_495433 [Circinella umbellata]|nr:hypothetical protein BDC45DRAFT_495433 [Circinella umbellata]
MSCFFIASNERTAKFPYIFCCIVIDWIIIVHSNPASKFQFCLFFFIFSCYSFNRVYIGYYMCFRDEERTKK